jgi:hypothetical protein
MEGDEEGSELASIEALSWNLPGGTDKNKKSVQIAIHYKFHLSCLCH